MRILIVEDDATVRKLIRRATADISEETVERADGAGALEAYEIQRPDIVLMDVKMPRMDGLTATRQLLQRYSEARIIILTDYDDEQLREAARDAGACAYALKNNLTDLEATIMSARV